MRRVEERWGSGFPFDVPAVAQVGRLQLDAPVTLLAGDNGTGKSTLIEAIAEAMGYGDEGGELERSNELPGVPRPVMGGALEPVLSATKPRKGYFLRAESFFNVAHFVDGGTKHAPDLSLYGDIPLHQQSHGQSFLALAANRFGGEGIYLLDEPEAALSVSGALALLTVVVRAPARERSSSSRRTRRSCWPAPTRTSTNSTARGSRGAPTTTSMPCASRGSSPTRRPLHPRGQRVTSAARSNRR